MRRSHSTPSLDTSRIDGVACPGHKNGRIISPDRWLCIRDTATDADNVSGLRREPVDDGGPGDATRSKALPAHDRYVYHVMGEERDPKNIPHGPLLDGKCFKLAGIAFNPRRQI